MRITATLALVLVFVLAVFCAVAQEKSTKPAVGTDTLTDEQLAVYRAVLRHYMKGSRGKLNLSSETYPMKLDKDCAKGIKPEQTENEVVHTFTAAAAPNVILVDPKQQKTKIEQNDPQNLMKKAIDEGAKISERQIDESVELAFSTGLFSLSEIIFDKGHHHAIVSYSFHCGMLCGHGDDLVLIRTGSTWKVKGSCGPIWVS